MTNTLDIERDQLDSAKSDSIDKAIAGSLNDILNLMYSCTASNFAPYKRNTLIRRIKRRMGLCHAHTVKQYLQLLQCNEQEVKQLARDCLINVTHFFRDSSAFELLLEKVVPKLVEQQGDEPLRIWVAGCATGEEAYSIAILLSEYHRQHNIPPQYQVFATDIEEDVLEQARKGIYSEEVMRNVPQKLQENYFRKINEGYQIEKNIRDKVIFAVQNLLSDPPFSKLDLIMCRNLLIYIEPDIQKKIIGLFHFALRDQGFLLLGTSETIGRQDSLFEVISKKERLFKRIIPHQKQQVSFPIVPTGDIAVSSSQPSFSQKTASLGDQLRNHLLQHHTPSAVIIDRHYNILYFYGELAPCLKVPAGEPNQNILALAVEGIRTKLRSAIYQAMRQDCAVHMPQIKLLDKNQDIWVSVGVEPFTKKKAADLFVITFQVINICEQTISSTAVSAENESIIRHLEYELHTAKEDLQSTIEEMESTNEELKASHEEVTSMNEELQSTNEELETSREELQSLNEELLTLNMELKQQMEEQTKTKNDVINLLTSTNIATIFLDTDFCIMRFTPATTRLLNLIGSDIGRPFSDISQKFNDAELLHDASKVLQDLVPSTRVVTAADQSIFERKILPYRTHDNKIEGVVITFTDITKLKVSEQTFKEKEEMVRDIINAMPFSISYVDSQEHYLFNNKLHEQWSQWSNRTGSRPTMRDILGEQIYEQSKPYIKKVLNGETTTFEITQHHPDLGERDWEVTFIPDKSDTIVEGFFIASTDITEFKKITCELAEAKAQLEHRVQERTQSLLAANKQLHSEIISRKQAETEHDKTKRYYQNLLENSTIGIVYGDDNGNCLYANQRTLNLVGVEFKQLEGHGWMQYTHPDDVDNVIKQWKSLFTTEQFIKIEYRVINQKNGALTWVELSAVGDTSAESEPTGFFGCLQDITLRHAAQEKLLEQERQAAHYARLATAGELLSGVSHEINQPLTSIVQYVGGCIEHINRGVEVDELKPIMSKVMAQAERAGAVVHRLKSFLRKGELKKQWVDPKEIINVVIALLDHDIKHNNISVDINLLSDTVMINVDKLQIEQVLLNLVKNACEALRDAKIAEPTVIISITRDEQFVKFSVCDNGNGVSNVIKDKIFEQFFTSKKEGMGMGLSISRSIVEGHGGSLSLESCQKIGGAHFYFSLPV